MRGAESELFLQGQLTQDVAAVDRDGRWSLLLAPDSAVLATCFVTRDDEGFSLIVPRSLAAAALARLRRFLLRVACTLALEEVATGPYATTMDLVDGGWPGADECAARLSPQSYGRGLVAATVSFTKGCYTGQELVGRLQARGSSVPWRLVRVTGPSVERINEVLKSKGPHGPQGVTTALARAGHVDGLGFAHRSLLDPGYLASFADVAVEPIA